VQILLSVFFVGRMVFHALCSQDDLRVAKPEISVIEQAIQTFYLRPERPGMIALLREISRACAKQKLKAPTYRTVRRRLGY
jgi:hypothetical protein